jgi:molybdate transport system ATP-binding protein
VIEIDIEATLGAFALAAKFVAPATGITALFGRSGAGKTSIVNALAGLLTPARGRIAVRDEVLFDSARKINLPPERRRLGYIFQEGRLFPHYSVRGNLLYGAKRADGAAFDRIVALLGLGDLLRRRPGDLSGGEKQRVAIGRAILAGPRLLLMDEPLAALDTARKEEILPFIAALRGALDIPVVYVSHAMEEVIRLADTLVLVDGGKIAATGTVEALTSRLDLRPLTGRFEAGAVIRTVLRGHDKAYGLSELAFPGGRLRVPHVDLPLGTKLRIRIHARDVVLATAPPSGLSIRNAFAGRVVEIAPEDGPSVDLRLDIGTAAEPVMLWVRITQRALADLRLQVGSPVHALVKTVALERPSPGGSRAFGEAHEAV